MLKTIGIIPIAPISRSSTRLDISCTPRLRADCTQKSRRVKRSRAFFRIIRLGEKTVVGFPEFVKGKDNLLKGHNARLGLLIEPWQGQPNGQPIKKEKMKDLIPKAFLTVAITLRPVKIFQIARPRNIIETDIFGQKFRHLVFHSLTQVYLVPCLSIEEGLNQ